jgi:integrase
MTYEKALAVSNTRLKVSSINFLIEVRSNHLVLRGILPPKPNSDRLVDYEQRIYLGYPVMLEGIRQAEKDAISIRAALIEKRFDWADWNKKIATQIANPADMSIGAVVAKFEIDYFNRRAKNPKSLSTWEGDYLMVYKTLPQSAQLNKETIMIAIATTAPQTRTRVRWCQALGAMAKFAGLDIDLSDYRKGYTPSKLEIRDLPNDAEVELYYGLIPNNLWQNAYALISVYGLRPSEIIHLDLGFLPELHVLDETKTGFRIVRPLHPKWIERFAIREDMQLPQIVVTNNKQVCTRVCHAFKRYAIPFPPDNLRHAYAVRCSIEYQMPVAIAAKMMGHSAAIHQDRYLRHMKQSTVNEIFDKQVAAHQF